MTPDASEAAPGAQAPPAAEGTQAPNPTPGIAPPAGAAPWHRFPRGAWAGNFLHGELEWLAGEGYALPPPDDIADPESPAATRHPVVRALRERWRRLGWERHTADLLPWLARLCHTPMPALGAPLSALDETLPEMEFWLPVDGLDSAEIDRLCRTHLWPGLHRPALPERRLRGLLMGFADLVYGHRGRWGVLDFKSNALGPTDAHYTEAAMVQAMLHHRYEVQAALYQLALHRLLRERLGARYQPRDHLHGAVYHFLRGIQGAHAGALHLPACLPLLDALDRAIPQGGPAAEDAP